MNGDLARRQVEAFNRLREAQAIEAARLAAVANLKPGDMVRHVAHFGVGTVVDVLFGGHVRVSWAGGTFRETVPVTELEPVPDDTAICPACGARNPHGTPCRNRAEEATR